MINERNKFIDYLKGWLIYLVTLGHYIQYVIYGSVGDFWSDPAFQLIYMYHMPLFMGVSGYVSRKSILSKPFTQVVAKRSIQLVMPMLSWALISSAIKAFNNRHTARIAAVPFIKDFAAKFLNTYWFLWSLLFSTALTSVICKITNESVVALSLFAMAVILIPLDEYVPHFAANIVTMTEYIFPFYVIGHVAAASPKAHKFLFIRQNIKTAFLVCVVVSALSFIYWQHDTYIYNSGMHTLSGNACNVALRLIAACSLAIPFCLIIHILWNKQFLPELFIRIGESSLSIYILQVFLFSVVYTLGKAVIFGGLIYILSPFAAFLLTYLLYFISLQLIKMRLPAFVLLGHPARKTI